MTRLIAIGECMVELSHSAADQLKLGFAGDSSNACIYLKRAAPEVEIQYLTTLGDDHYSDAILQMWRDEGIDTSLVKQLPGELPGLSIIQNTPDGERSFYYWRGQSAFKQLPEMLPEVLPAADYLYVSGITLAATLPEKRPQILTLMQSMVSRGTRLIFDPNYRARLWSAGEAMDMIESVLPLTDTFLTSDEDIAQLTSNPDDFLELVRSNCREVVLRRGDAPCTIWSDGDEIEVSTTPVTAVDTTGAGDSFNGTYIGNRLSGDDVRLSATKAHEMAAKVVQHKGAITPR